MPHRYFSVGQMQLVQLGVDADDEDAVLAAMTGPKKDKADFWGTIVLKEIGTKKSVDVLTQCLDHRNKDLQALAMEALARILKEEGQDLYVARLKDTAFSQKLEVMHAIRDYCDDRAVEPVVLRLKRVISRPPKHRAHDDDEMTEVTYGLDYLRRCGGPAAEGVFDLVRKNWDRLDPWVCSWVTAQMPELLQQGAGAMSPDELIAALRKAKFFEGYPETARSRAEKQIRADLKEGLAGPGAKYFKRYPGYALIFLSIDGEWDEPYKPLVSEFAKATFGMFQPKRVTEKRSDDLVTLSFIVNDKKYSATADTTEAGGWIPTEYLELIEQALKEQCGGLQIFETYYPEAGQCSSWTFCTKRAHRAIVKAGLIPGDPDDVRDIDWDAA